MPSANASPLVAVLLRVAYHAPKPWFFRAGLEKSAKNEEAVASMVELLELLHAEGLVDKVPAVTPEEGPGVVLTPKGRQVAMDPEAKERLAAGHALDEGAGSQVRASIRTGMTPWLTRAIILANVAVFAIGWWWAWSKGFATVYAYGAPRTALDAQRYLFFMRGLGNLDGPGILRGEWWRILACAFLHYGLLHLLMNMLFMWSVGAFVERVYGRWRMAAIYAMSVWISGCLILAHAPFSRTAGASGAACGLFAAMGVWTLLAGRHLPRALASSLRTSLFMNVVIIVVISLMPGVSYWGHLGGAIGGAAAGLVLHLGRFAPVWGRALALAALPGIAFAGFWWMQEQRGTNKEWEAIEAPRFVGDIGAKVQDDSNAALKAYAPMETLFGMRASRREADKMAEAIEGMKEPLEQLEKLGARLRDPWPYRSKPARQAAKVAREYVEARAAYYREAIRALELGEKWTRADEKAHVALSDKMLEGRKEWEAEIRELRAEKQRK